VATGRKVHESRLQGQPAPESREVRSYLSPDGKVLAVLQWDAATSKRIVCLHDTATGARIHHWPCPEPSPRGFAFSHDSRLLAGAMKESTLFVWDVASGKELRRHALDSSGIVWHYPDRFAFAPGNTSVLASDGSNLVGWDWRTGKTRLRHASCDMP